MCKPKWISIKDGLPEKDGPILVVTNQGWGLIEYSVDTKAFHNNVEHLNDIVTHYMEGIDYSDQYVYKISD